MKTAVRVGLVGLMAATLFSWAPAAMARQGNGGSDVVTSGSCSGASTWKLKLSPDNAQIEVEFEVDQNVVGDTWKLVMRDNGTVFFKGRATTTSASGSFEVRQLTADLEGSDHIVAKALNLSTGETCKGRATL
jgi:hypothetical protein